LAEHGEGEFIIAPPDACGNSVKRSFDKLARAYTFQVAALSATKTGSTQTGMRADVGCMLEKHKARIFRI
jgi:hypothetical protein